MLFDVMVHKKNPRRWILWCPWVIRDYFQQERKPSTTGRTSSRNQANAELRGAVK